MQLNQGWLDVLTGHAAARFKYVDVRDRHDFEREPPRFPVLHIPLAELRARARDALDLNAELIVYGTNDFDSEAAEADLRALGFKRVMLFEGGFDALSRAGLI